MLFAVLQWQRGRSCDAMYRRSTLSRQTLDEAIGKLERAGVVTVTRRLVTPSPALLVLDGMNVIGV